MGTAKNNLSYFDLALQKQSHEQTTSILKSSIAKEQNGKSRQMANKIVSLEDQVKTLRKHLILMVEHFECNFSKDAGMSVELAQDYVNAAKYLRDTFNRKGDIITHVEMWIDSPESLPFK